MTDDIQLLTDQEASNLLRISRGKFSLLVARGEIPRIKIGRSARYRSADIAEFVRRMSDAAS